MVLMNLLAGQEWRCGRRDGIVDAGDEEGSKRAALIYTQYHV